MPKMQIIKRPVEQVGGNLKKSAWSAIIESLAILIFGILLVVWNDTVVVVVANIIGAIFIINGIYQVINYFISKGQKDFFNNNLLIGVISALAGIIILVAGENIVGFFRIIIGIWMIYESLVRINTAIKLNSAGISTWRVTLILAIIMLALGIFVTFNAGAITALIGWMMILVGLVGIIGDIMFIQHVNQIVDKLTSREK